MFFLDQAFKFLKHSKINNYTIELVDGQQPLYGLIYSLKLIELEILKAYIKINLVNKFIKPSKLSTSAPIIFKQKLNKHFQLCINYQGLNNLTIKNWYPLPLIVESLN